MKKGISGIDSLVLFQNSQGIEGRGTLIHLTRNLVVFEVYNPYSIVQLSEVLQDFRILRGESTVYTGRAVVSNLVPTGLMVIVSASLLSPWSDLAGLAPGDGLREEVERFVQEWDASHALRPLYQLAVSNLRAFLGEMSQLLEQVDVASEADRLNASPALEQALFQEVAEPIMPKMEELFAVFEHEASQIPPKEVGLHKAFAHRELHPLMLCAPFVHRSYSKPLGYAGDYEMVNMILRDPGEGSTTYAKIVNTFILRKDTATAHRNRINMLFERLRSEAQRKSMEGRAFRVMTVGCGPASELQRFIKNDPLSERGEYHLLDFNDETIAHVKGKIEQIMGESHRNPIVEYQHKSIHDLLREARERSNMLQESYDMVYCAGLLDYLPDRICRRLLRLFYNWTKPGGLIVATNVHPSNPIVHIMDYILEWHLICRAEAKMAELAGPLGTCQVNTDETGLNVFLDIRKQGT